MLTFRQMTIFRAVMETSTLTEAARVLRLSQPGVSKCVREIEDLLQFPLFKRESGRLAPTKEARSFYENVLVALRAMDSVERSAENYRDARSGYVRIAATSTLAHSLIPPAVEMFKRERPAAQIIINTALNHEVVRMVTDLEVDFGLVLLPTNHAGTVANGLCAAKLVAVMPTGHPLSKRKTISPTDLAPFPLISYNRKQPIGLTVDEQFKRAGVERVIAIEIIQSATACSLVAAGAGIAVVDSYALMNHAFPNLAVRPLTPLATMRSALLTPSAQEPARLASAFLKSLKHVINNARKRGELISE